MTDKKRTPVECAVQNIKIVMEREGIADVDSVETIESGQPGGRIRRWLNHLNLTRIGYRDNWPVTRISPEREGD